MYTYIYIYMHIYTVEGLGCGVGGGRGGGGGGGGGGGRFEGALSQRCKALHGFLKLIEFPPLTEAHMRHIRNSRKGLYRVYRKGFNSAFKT